MRIQELVRAVFDEREPEIDLNYAVRVAPTPDDHDGGGGAFVLAWPDASRPGVFFATCPCGCELRYWVDGEEDDR